MEQGSRKKVMRSNRPLATSGTFAVLALILVAASASLATAGPQQTGYHFRVDTTRNPIEIQARFTILQDKDFAFMGTLSGHPVDNLQIRDSRGERQVSPAGEPGIYKIDGLKSGQVTASYTLQLGTNCLQGSCRDSGGVMFMTRDLLIHPVGMDPVFPTPVRIDMVMPGSWILVTTGGQVEGPLRGRNLHEAGQWPILAGDLVTTEMNTNDLIVVQSTGWQVPPEDVGALVASYFSEHNRLLGNWRDNSMQRLIRIIPGTGSQASFGEVAPGLDLVQLPGDRGRSGLAAAVIRPLAHLFNQRLEQGLAGASSPETQWWRQGFTEYTTLLAGVRAGSLDDQVILDRILDAWVNVSSRSPLARKISPAAAGEMEDKHGRRFVRDSGVLACFLLDLQIRGGSGNKSGVGELLASTRGRLISNDLLLQEASRLAGTDLTSLFKYAVTGTGPVPLQQQAPLAGLEMADTGTGEIFLGMVLAADEPVITRVFDSGPARARGLKAGDRIVELNGQPVNTAAAVDQILASHTPGDALEVKVQTADGETYVTVLDLWERVAPVLRRSRQASLAALNAWSNLVRGEATTFAN